MANFLKEVNGVPRGTAMALTDLPSISNDTFLGNISGSAATPSALTATQVTANLNLFTASLQGLVPASGGGTTNFLRADGTWTTTPSGFTNPMTTTGDIIVGGTSGAAQRLGVGSDGQVLTVVSGAPAWGAGSSPSTFGSRSSPLSIAAGTGLVSGTNVSTTALVQVSFVKGSGGPITISASPAIAAGTIVGQELQIIGRDSTNTVTIPNQSGYVELNGPCTLGAGDMLTVICDGTVWTEKCRSN